ncbi:hypothetical protein THH46_26615 [Pseudomonas sp. NA13]
MRVHYLPEQPAGSAIVDTPAALWGPPACWVLSAWCSPLSAC